MYKYLSFGSGKLFLRRRDGFMISPLHSKKVYTFMRFAGSGQFAKFTLLLCWYTPPVMRCQNVSARTGLVPSKSAWQIYVSGGVCSSKRKSQGVFRPGLCAVPVLFVYQGTSSPSAGASSWLSLLLFCSLSFSASFCFFRRLPLRFATASRCFFIRSATVSCGCSFCSW